MTIKAIDSKLDNKLKEIRDDLSIPEFSEYTAETKNIQWINNELRKAKNNMLFYLCLFIFICGIILLFGVLGILDILDFEMSSHTLFSTLILVFNALGLLSLRYRYKLKMQRLLYAKYLNEIKIDLEGNIETPRNHSLKVS